MKSGLATQLPQRKFSYHYYFRFQFMPSTDSVSKSTFEHTALFSTETLLFPAGFPKQKRLLQLFLGLNIS